MHGHPDRAAELAIRRAAEAHAIRPAPGQEFRYARTLARASNAIGRFDVSRRALLEVWTRDDPRRPWDVITKDLAGTAAAAGDRDEALRLMAMFEETANPLSGGWHSLEIALIWAALGEAEETARMIGQSRAEGNGFAFWLHESIPLARLKGYPPVDDLMRPRN